MAEKTALVMNLAQDRWSGAEKAISNFWGVMVGPQNLWVQKSPGPKSPWSSLWPSHACGLAWPYSWTALFGSPHV